MVFWHDIWYQNLMEESFQKCFVHFVIKIFVNQYLTRRSLKPQGFIQRFQTLYVTFKNYGTCFSILSTHFSDKNTNHLPSDMVIVQKWVCWEGGWSTHPKLQNYFWSHIFHSKLFLLRHFCHRTGENRMFQEFLWSMTSFVIFLFLPFWRTGRNNDVTWKLLVLIFVDIDRRDQDLIQVLDRYIIEGPLL